MGYAKEETMQKLLDATRETKEMLGVVLSDIRNELAQLNDRAALNRQERIARERGDGSKKLTFPNAKIDAIKHHIRELNRLTVGYSEYTKISAPLLSDLKEMGLTTSAVKVVASVNDEQIPF